MGTDRLTSAILDFPAGQASFICSTQLIPYQRINFLGTRGRIELEIPFNAPPDRPTRLFIDATGDRAYVRFHGRNRDAWYGKHDSAAERFKYLYAERELAEKAAQLKLLGERGVERAYVMFNNCYQNFGILNATTM